jgi:prolyl-tRNA editing enzyme YbaK/EbsC (Cys-tRNA(Pro) deacylase)
VVEVRSPQAQRVQDALASLGLDLRVVELPGSTRTAEEAARAIGCAVGQIVKSLVFRVVATDRALLVAASGVNRVSLDRLAELAGGSVERASPDFVRARTGFAIGGVPPVAHVWRLESFLDEDLFAYPTLWAAAGTPHAVFAVTPQQLQSLTRGVVVRIKDSPPAG